MSYRKRVVIPGVPSVIEIFESKGPGYHVQEANVPEYYYDRSLGGAVLKTPKIDELIAILTQLRDLGFEFDSIGYDLGYYDSIENKRIILERDIIEGQ